jgi:hypothetical protein
MNLRTFGQLKSQIARVCGATGMPATDTRVMEFTNLAVEEILNEGDFPWTVDRLIFRVYQGRVVLPTAYDRIISMSVNGISQMIASPWFETTTNYLAGQDLATNWNGPNLNGWFNNGFTMDRDEVFQFRDIPKDQQYFLEVMSQFQEEEGSTILFKGYDSALAPVTTKYESEWIEGERMELTTGWVRSSTPFSQISGIVKPITEGEVYLYAVGATTGERIHIGTYAPKDESPYYRSYKITGTALCGCSCVLARCRKRYSPVLKDDDLVMCGNIPALKKMVQAVWYGDAGDPQKYANYKAIAVDILKKEATAFRGKSRIPAITMQHGFSIGAMPYIR